MPRDELRAYMDIKPEPPVMGVETNEELLRWLWEQEFAAVGGDMLTFEMQPPRDPAFYGHEWLIAGWGMPIGELFDLERLSVECKRLKRWTFFFSSMPLNVRDATRNFTSPVFADYGVNDFLGPWRHREPAQWSCHLVAQGSAIVF